MNEFENKNSAPEEDIQKENMNDIEDTGTMSSCAGSKLEETSEKSSEKGGSDGRSILVSVYEYAEPFCFALALMMVLLLFVFRLVTVDGASMQHTLHHQDKLIISNLFYTPETGDIVVINPESHGGSQDPIIKRVIATEGQTVYIDYQNWAVYVDGIKLDEPYIEAMRQEYATVYGDDVWMDGSNVTKYCSEFTVGENMVFVMGDNRNNSIDSRSAKYGEMSETRILGRVIIRLAPNFGTVD